MNQLHAFRSRAVLALTLLALTLGILSGCAATAPDRNTARAPKNIIILFGDGAAATQWELGRYTSQALRNKPFVITDVVFRQGSLGLLTVHSADSFVTDSAAAATAMSTGHKTNNGMTGMTPDGKPVRTVMEAAKARGKRIGLVTTAAVHDASPAGFAAHAKSRRDAQTIVNQYFDLEPDVLLGGGRDFFLPKGMGGGKRNDSRDMLTAFRDKGYDVVQSPAALREARGKRLLGLFSDEDLDFELDRKPQEEPSTAEMAAAAIRVLSADNPNGFVLFIENEGIDTAGHRNDAAALIRDLWALDDAVQLALDFQRRTPGETLIIVTGDHETGGLSVSYALRDLSSVSSANRLSPADAHLQLVSGIRVSLERAVELLGRKPTEASLDKVLAENFPGFILDADLRSAILERRVLERNVFYIPHGALARMVSRQTGFYWGTSGHTTEPVIVGAIGPGAELFRGYMDNTDFGKILHKLIDAR
jgi:alkaline phosphatase